MKRWLVTCALVVCFASPSAAQWSFIAVHDEVEGDPWSCIEYPPQGQYRRLYVVVTGQVSLSYVRFIVHPSPCLGILTYEPIFPATVGDPTYGVAVDFGGCLAPPIHVLSLVVYTAGEDDCCYTSIEVQEARDCEGNPAQLMGDRTLVDNTCVTTDPASPFPPDGATNVPVDVTLRWSESDGPNACTDIMWYFVDMGTTSNPELVYFSGDTFYDPLHDFAENTTYYWRVRASRYGPGGSSPVWRFTTTGPLTVKQSTWGRIKALYR